MTLLRLISPVDDSVLLEREAATSSHLDEAVRAAVAAQAEWAGLALDERVSRLARGIAQLEQEADEAGREISRQMGRPVRYASGEIRTAAARARHMLAVAPRALDADEVAPGRIIGREPVGVILVIAPWNYPYLTAINSIVPALAAGNAVILKHSFQTALSADRMVRALSSGGLPPGLLQALHADDPTTLEAIHRQEVGHVVFTGSVAVGQMVAVEAARHLKTVTLELGGKDAAYVRADANLDAAVAGLVEGSYFNSGQSCCAIERIYVDRAVYPEFLRRFSDEAEALVLGSPLDERTTVGPVARAREAQLVREQIDEAIAQGAQQVLDASDKVAGPTRNYLRPQALIGVTHAMRLMREESFGPVVGIMPVDDDEAAVRLINDSRYGLTASVWTQDVERFDWLADRIDAGTVYQNRCDYLDPALPWSGRRQSGFGLSLSHLAYQALTRTKSRLLEPGRAGQRRSQPEQSFLEQRVSPGDDR